MIMTTTNYYIDGRLVSLPKALAYWKAGIEYSIAAGYADMADCIDAWKGRNKSEESRELISNLTGWQDLGGLEIIVELN
jgi:hypothetical protein